MPDLLLIVSVLLGVCAVAILVVLVARSGKTATPQTDARFDALEKGLERAERILRDEMTKSREESAVAARQLREETAGAVKAANDSLVATMARIAELQKNQLDSFSRQLQALTESNEKRLAEMRATIEGRLQLIQKDNSEKLEQMRATVDEKLHATLEKRLGESFKLVSDRLELVHKGLGEMQTLASSVGDLKKVLTNVKTRGTWGEIQLGSLLEQILTKDQFAQNVVTKKGSAERVEFAVRLPGQQDGEVFLPVDAKFPQEDYQRLVDAYEQSNHELAEEAKKQLVVRIKQSAKDIRDKYIDPPNTTDFGIMFLPVEGLYAEVLRLPGLVESLQREHRVIVTGPTTLAALLNSLQMGFRTLAIEKRSSEVWMLLGAVKSEFGKFGDILDKTQEKLRQASDTIENAARKSRTIERRLKTVQELPSAETAGVLGGPEEE